MANLRVNLGSRSYDIAIASGAANFARFVRECQPRLRQAFFVSDQHTEVHAAEAARKLREFGVETRCLAVAAGEQAKSLANAERLWDALAEWPADRQTLVVAVGGGVVGDLAGFAASTFNRGLPLFMVPTTLLAMVDSSVGGKVAINHRLGKNLIGAFHQPRGVWIDTRFLNTLPDREFRSGLAEVVKYGMILDAEFFHWLEANVAAVLARDAAALEHLIARCCRLKADVVEQDEREETGLRMVLNYGHTFAHAFETIGGYGAWLHGEAVAAGMICASRLAERRSMIDSAITIRQTLLLEAFGLPTAPKPEWPVDELVSAMRRDKKAVSGKLRFVLPTRIGAVEVVDDVAESLVAEVLTCR